MRAWKTCNIFVKNTIHILWEIQREFEIFWEASGETSKYFIKCANSAMKALLTCWKFSVLQVTKIVALRLSFQNYHCTWTKSFLLISSHILKNLLLGIYIIGAINLLRGSLISPYHTRVSPRTHTVLLPNQNQYYC